MDKNIFFYSLNSLSLRNYKLLGKQMPDTEKLDLSAMRVHYTSTGLIETNVNADPTVQFSAWMNDALQTKIEEPNAMTLATVSEDGSPNARIVLLKEFDRKGFVFFTNFESVKGTELTINKSAALNFFWKELGRQVRVKGKVEKVSQTESEEYFHSRPRESQIGAWASHQSQKIKDRSYLEMKFQELQNQFEGKEIPLPDFWGGYRVIPFEIEFWQGRENRLHDRIVYTLENEKWIISRLSP